MIIAHVVSARWVMGVMTLGILGLAGFAILPAALWADVPVVKVRSRGVVVDSVTTHPIAGVRVIVLESADTPPGCRPLEVTEITTDSLGVYSVLLDCDAPCLGCVAPGSSIGRVSIRGSLESASG